MMIYIKETALHLGGTFVISATFATGVAINGGCNTIYRACIAYTEGEINGIM